MIFGHVWCLLGGRVQRSINSVRLISEYGASIGLSNEQLLAGSNIKPAQLGDGNNQINDEQELVVLTNLARLTKDPFTTGMALATYYPLTSYGIWGFALLASPNLNKAISLGLRYVDLTYAFCHIELVRKADKARIVFTPKCQGDVAQLVLYRDMWALMEIQQDLFWDQMTLFTLGFQLPQPAQLVVSGLNALQAHNKVLFDQSSNYVEFDWQYLDMPLPRGNDATASMCEQQCQLLLEQKQSLTGIAFDIRQLMLKYGMHISMEYAAEKLAITSRTLHRQLKAQKTSWRTVRDNVRCAMAEELLAAGNIQLDEIAERLGFSDGANFSHAFKRWRGVSPLQFRKTNGVAGVK